MKACLCAAKKMSEEEGGRKSVAHLHMSALSPFWESRLRPYPLSLNLGQSLSTGLLPAVLCALFHNTPGSVPIYQLPNSAAVISSAIINVNKKRTICQNESCITHLALYRGRSHSVTCVMGSVASHVLLLEEDCL